MNPTRLSKFTSSSIYNLTGFGRDKVSPSATFTSYVNEKIYEYQAGRSLSEAKSKPTSWGNFCEKYVYEVYLKYTGLDLESKLFIESEDPYLKGFYGGTPDLVGITKVGDIKCPFTLKSYLQAYNCTDISDLRKNHPDGEKYYWQLASNSILTKKNICELIFWVPRGYTVSELGEEDSEIIRLHEKMKHSDDVSVKWAVWEDTEALPYLLNPKTDQIKMFEFEPPQADKDFLLERLGMAVAKVKEKCLI